MRFSTILAVRVTIRISSFTSCRFENIVSYVKKALYRVHPKLSLFRVWQPLWVLLTDFNDLGHHPVKLFQRLFQAVRVMELNVFFVRDQRHHLADTKLHDRFHVELYWLHKSSLAPVQHSACFWLLTGLADFETLIEGTILTADIVNKVLASPLHFVFCKQLDNPDKHLFVLLAHCCSILNDLILVVWLNFAFVFCKNRSEKLEWRFFVRLQQLGNLHVVRVKPVIDDFDASLWINNHKVSHVFSKQFSHQYRTFAILAHFGLNLVKPKENVFFYGFDRKKQVQTSLPVSVELVQQNG